MLTLLTFPPMFGLRSPSPPAMKAEMLLTMSGLPFEKKFGDVRKTPKGKFPVLVDGDKVIPDSSHIQLYLEQEKDIDFDGHLSDQQRAVATAFRRLVEDHLYFINSYFRWSEHGDALKEAAFGAVPGLIRGFIFKKIQKGVIHTAHMQGIARHSREEIVAFAKEDLDAIATLLSDQPYMFGETISSLDASVYGALHGLVDCELDTPVKAECLKHENLVAYCANIQRTVFDGA